MDEHAVGARTTGDHPPDSAPPRRPQCGLLQLDRYRIGTTIVAIVALAIFQTALAEEPAGDEALLAVAANFAEVIELLKGEFEQETGHSLTVSVASTGTLYAQIKNGAPFDILLAADQERPRLLEGEGLAVPGSRFTYAVGRLTLWSPEAGRIAANGAETLKLGDFRKLAIANPDLAPYGLAARETLEALELDESLEDRIVMGENIGQTHAMVATGNADLGFVALSYVLSPRNESKGSRWDVPQELYTPIRQDAVLLMRAAENAAARDFLAWLQGEDARARIREFGYAVE
ncbi:MAG TPA: molybdate ABC transporter substrate-binding protein [Woeseiaceae bacterium]|nr:molybdate ABC transporter substrate-binding protein [Woeseiaceae bacterium]